MVKRIDVSEFVNLSKSFPILDVRSPAEFQKGYIPNAFSFPLFSDEERAEVGTIYKHVGPDAAVARGLEIVQPKIQDLYARGLSMAQDNTLMVHCWRGGKRSESVARMLALSGKEVYVLENGYKAFRNWAFAQFEKPLQMQILGGFTGTGKTEILGQLALKNQSIIDLEDLAHHRGSAFGALGQEESLTQMQFENELAVQLHKFEPNAQVWFEDESRGIGRMIIPQETWNQMSQAHIYFVDLPKEARIERLVVDYGNFPKDMLRTSIQKIERRLGGLRTRQVLAHLEAGNAHDVVDILLDYYDKLYRHGLSKHPTELVTRLNFDSFDAEAISKAVQDAANAK